MVSLYYSISVLKYENLLFIFLYNNNRGSPREKGLLQQCTKTVAHRNTEISMIVEIIRYIYKDRKATKSFYLYYNKRCNL